MKTITIYSTPQCGFCQQLKTFLHEKKIPFEDHNVMEDEVAREKMMKLTSGGTSVPVIVFNEGQDDEEIQVGYDPKKVQTILEL